ncbi:unnamed protein product [Rotaria sp. Silwood1]|nr:unnamed protein product [Rotaria sp. Silwood1]
MYLLKHDSSYKQLLYDQTNFDCFDDPLITWCQNQIHICNSSLIIFNKLFAKTQSIILQRKFAQGKRKGGEDLDKVLNQNENDEYFHFNKSFIQLSCNTSLPTEIFKNSHLSDIFSSITSYHTWRDLNIINETTIAVNRYDYVNFYHTITDLYTVYLLCRFFRLAPKSVHILFLDAHPKGNLDLLWSQLFHSFIRLGHLNNSLIFYKELIWSPPQAQSELDLKQSRKIAPSYFFDFRQHILEKFHISSVINKDLDCQNINIFFLVRHNYIAHPRNPTGEITRQLINENQILNDLKRIFQNISSIHFTYNHFEQLPMQQQLSIIIQTDIFIGMHGAGLTHVLFMKTNRFLIEITTTVWQKQTHFEQMASINNIHYHRCLILNGHSTTAQTIFNCLTKTLFQMCSSFKLSINSIPSLNPPHSIQGKGLDDKMMKPLNFSSFFGTYFLPVLGTACPEGTKPCKDDNNMCVTYCNGNPECADGSDELDCATDAPVITSDSIAFAQSTEPSGNGNEPANVPGGTTDIIETTLPQVTVFDRETVPTEDVNTVVTQQSTAGEAQEATTVLADATAAAAADATAASPAADATTAAGADANADDTTAGADAATTAAGADANADATTAAAAAADDATTAAAGDADATVAPTAADATTAAAEADATTGASADADATAASAAADATTAAADADATTGVADADATTGAADADATTEAAESGVTGDTTSGSDGAATTADANVETSTGADDLTSAKPGNGHVTEDESSTAGVTGDDTSAHDVSDQVTTVEAATTDSNTATTAGDATTADDTSDVTTDSSTDAANGHDVSATTVKEDTTAAPVQPEPSGRVELRVVVSPEILEVQRGQTYELTCTVYGADASTTIYWIQEEPERRYALTDPAGPDDKQVTLSQVSLKARITIDDPSKIGKYTCMAQDTAGNSGAAILTMEEGRYYPPVYPPVYPPIVPGGGGQGYLRIVAPDMAEGDYVEIQCENAKPEDEGRIQWFFNNRLLSDEQPLYPRGKTLHIRPISRPYLGNYRCSIPGSGYADGISVLTFGGPVPTTTVPSYPSAFTVTIDIVQGQTAQGQAQENTQVILRCRPSEQATSYRWTFTSSQGPDNRGYTDQLVIPRVTLQDSGVYTCEATSTRGQTARGTVNLYVNAGPQQPIAGRCGVDEATCRNGRCIPRAYLFDGKNDCGDNSDEGTGSSDACQPNEIGCTNADRGRKCVQKFWMCDGDRDCDDGSDEDQRYCEILPRQRYCKPSEFHCGGSNATTPNPICIPRSFQCDGYNDCPDRSDEVGCVKPIVVSAPQRQIQVHVGQTLTIQCIARGSPAPYINWRLNWGHVCGDGSDNGRCTMAQTVDPNDPHLITGTLTVRNVISSDGGAYSCEALNNQGFIFAIPDAIVDVIIVSGPPPTPAPLQCNCHGHSSYCTSTGQCLNCQHNTAGYSCEFCAPGYQGDARRGTPYDCQPVTAAPPTSRCNPAGTHMDRGDRCICKYNVEGARCDQCKRSHFYLNPTTPNGCLPCFCSGVSTDCTSTDWRRQPIPLPLNNWNVVPKTFATDPYEARDRIQQRHGGREIALDQSSLGRSANEVLYWKAPKETLGNVVTLYDGNIDIHFTNDGNDNEAPSNDEFIWLRGNNIDLVHKLPQNQRFKANSNATYSVPCNERTFTRKDGTYIDRENILMALSDLDTLLVKINPIGGRRNAVLRGVTLNVAARDGYTDPAPTVESCRCPANYTGTSCEKCAEGYGRPHPLVGIYLGQCWSCRSLCNDRSDRCDRDTGRCLDCQANSEGDRCERCRPGYILDPRLNQCTRDEQYPSYPVPPYEPAPRGAYYVDQRPYDTRGTTPLTIVLDGNLPEQHVPLQVLNAQPRSVVWGRTDGSPLPANVVQEGNDLVFRNPSAEQAGNYICTITHPDGFIERIAIYLDYRPGQRQPISPPFAYPVFSPPSPLTILEGDNQFIQPQGALYQVYWRRDGGQPLPLGITQNGNGLQITDARSEHSGTYYCEVYGNDGSRVSIPYELRVQRIERPRPVDRPHASTVGAPKITIEPRVINLKEGQRMIVQYTVSSHDPIEVKWNKWTDQGYQPISALFTVEPNRLVLNRATPEAAGTYQVVVSNAHGEDRQELRINVEPRRGRGREQQAGAPRIQFSQDHYDISAGQVIDIVPTISGASGAKATWSKDGSGYLPEGVIARNDGALRVEGRSNNVDGRYTLDVTNAYGRVSAPIVIRWRETAGTQSAHAASQGGHVNQNRRVHWNVQRVDLHEGRRLEAACRGDVDPLSLRLDVTRHNGQQREPVPLGLSFSNGYLSLGAVTVQDSGLEFTCSSANDSDTLTLTVRPSSHGQDGGRSFIDVRLEPRDEQSHQIGREIHLQCAVQGSVERPYEYTFTKDGQPLENNVEVHPNGLLIIRNAQASDAGRYRCEVSFPRAPEAGIQESSYDLRIEGGSAGGYDQSFQSGGEYQPQAEYIEVTIEPSEVTLGRGEKANLTCRVKGAQQYTITWAKYAHDTSLPNYARQQGNSVILAPTEDSPAEQMYLQCSVAVPGQPQPYHGYAPVTLRANDELRKKKKKRRS